ncbi:MAG: polyvinyl alcohol dehydrogenase (cytochrome) [Gammaproteobacteria bacterium]|jgi:polyvinyl alcohol dehydrogenase (cytochrome)
MIKIPASFLIYIFTLPLIASAADGQISYKQHCASCHESSNSQIPSFSQLQKLSPASIHKTLSTGTMRQIGAGLSESERVAVSEFITGGTYSADSAKDIPLKYCDTRPDLQNDFLQQSQWNGWGVDSENTRFQPARAAALMSKDVPRLKLKWVFAYPGEVLALGQTNVIGGRLFVPSNSGNVYSLDAETGCAYWLFQADSSVRTAVSAGQLSTDSKDDFLVYFTDTTANAYAVNAADGTLVWKTKIESHPAVRVTGASQLYKGKLYVPISTLESVTAMNPDYQCCTHRGSVVALDAYTGKIEWQSYTIIEEPKQVSQSNASGTSFHGPSGAGVWSAPTIDAKLNVLYIGTGENSSEPTSGTSDSIMAMNLSDGKILWTYQARSNDAWNSACISDDRSNCPGAEGPDYDFGASPILVSLNEKQRVLIAVQKSGEIHALDPDNKGALLWKQQASPGGFQGGVMWGAASDGENVYVALSDREGDLFINAKGSPDWKIKSNKGGGVHAYRLRDGKPVWRAPAPVCDTRKQCSPAQSGAVSAIPGVIFAGAYDGHIRAYSSVDGKVIWDYDTVKEYDAVNGIKAQGGALDGPGPTIVNGFVYVNSGYARWGGLAGNALLAFSVK